MTLTLLVSPATVRVGNSFTPERVNNMFKKIVEAAPFVASIVLVVLGTFVHAISPSLAGGLAGGFFMFGIARILFSSVPRGKDSSTR